MKRFRWAATAALAGVIACVQGPAPGGGAATPSKEAPALSSAIEPGSLAALAEDWRTEPGGPFCLATAIYFEARGEPPVGRLAVGRVVLNRVESDVYPDTICGVVFQNAHLANRCQFSFACDGTSKPILEPTAWRDAMRQAAELIDCGVPCAVRRFGHAPVWLSTHYHADYVEPYWASSLERTMTIGHHIFYLEERT